MAHHLANSSENWDFAQSVKSEGLPVKRKIGRDIVDGWETKIVMKDTVVVSIDLCQYSTVIEGPSHSLRELFGGLLGYRGFSSWEFERIVVKKANIMR